MVPGFFDSLPDLHVEVEDVVVVGEPGGERATLRWQLTGTHTGEPSMGIAATGRPVELFGMDLVDFENGRIAGNCIYFDSSVSRDKSECRLPRAHGATGRSRAPST